MNTIMFENLSSKQLSKAAQLKERIETLEQELEQVVGQGTSVSRSTPSISRVRPAGKGGMSAAGKAHIVAAQKARWAKFNADKGANASVDSKTKPKRTMSPAGRAKIAAAARKRWKQAKAAGKSSL
jgi:hypothetical protein